MNTAILLNTLVYGGAERVASHILKYYSNNSKPIILILFKNSIKLDIPKNVKVFFLDETTIFNNHLFNFIKLPFLAYRLLKILKIENINVCLSLTTRPNYVNILSSFYNKKIKHIISERSCPSQEYGGINLKSYINRFLIKFLYNKRINIISNSIGNKNDLIENFGINKSKIKVINNPLDLKFIENSKRKINFFDKNFINFVSVGRLDSNKNFKMMIEVISKLKNKSVRLYVIGTGQEYSQLSDLIDECCLNEQVFLIGEKNNPFKYIKAADAFLFTSKSEGFPNVLIESLACGTPIISHNCKAGPDEILVGKIIENKNIVVNDFGILTPFNDKDKYLEALSLFIENKSTWSSKNLKKYKMKVDKYGINKIVNQYSAFLKI